MNIKPFNKFFEDSDEMRLMKDLEDLGAKERTWSEEEIRDVLDGINYDDYFECSVDESEVEYSFNERRQEIQASYVGGFNPYFDTDSMWDEIKSDLYDLPVSKPGDEEDEEMDYYTIDQIEAAFDNVNWDRVGDLLTEEISYDEIEWDFDTNDQGGGVLEFSATPSLTSKPEIDDKDIREEIMGNL
jgi:hypothetical protein